jgi:hypothetical protein
VSGANLKIILVGFAIAMHELKRVKRRYLFASRFTPLRRKF